MRAKEFKDTFNTLAIEELEEAIFRLKVNNSLPTNTEILVTGASGFFGQWIVSVLIYANLNHGCNNSLLLLTRDKEAFDQKCPQFGLQNFVTIIQDDVTKLDLHLSGKSLIIHAAADTSQQADSDPLNLSKSIIDGTQRILEIAQLSDSKVVTTSSGAVYGTLLGEVGVRETYQGACATDDVRSSYGQAKRQAEQYCTIYNNMGVDVKIARCFAFAGPLMNFNGHFAFGNFIRDSHHKKKIVITGDGSPMRSFLYPSDLVVWLLTILQQGVSGRIYNVGSDEEISVGQLALRINGLLSGPGVDIALPSQTSQHRNWYVPDVHRIRDELRVDVWTDFTQVILRTAKWYRDNC